LNKRIEFLEIVNPTVLAVPEAEFEGPFLPLVIEKFHPNTSWLVNWRKMFLSQQSVVLVIFDYLLYMYTNVGKAFTSVKDFVKSFTYTISVQFKQQMSWTIKYTTSIVV